jgi:hypothetical protein
MKLLPLHCYGFWCDLLFSARYILKAADLLLCICLIIILPLLWSSGQHSQLQNQRSGFDSKPREYNWGATWKKSSGTGLESRKYCRTDPSRWPRGTLYRHKLSLTSPTSGGQSVSIVRSRTKAMESYNYFNGEYWLMQVTVPGMCLSFVLLNFWEKVFSSLHCTWHYWIQVSPKLCNACIFLSLIIILSDIWLLQNHVYNS